MRPSEDYRIVVLKASAEYCISMMILLTYGNILTVTLNFTYFFYFFGKLVFLDGPPPNWGSDVLKADQNINYVIYLILVTYNSAMMFINFAAFLAMKSKLLNYYLIGNIIYIPLAAIFTIYITFIGVPCLKTQFGTFRYCLLLPTLSFFLLVWNSVITSLMVFVYRRLKHINVSVRQEGYKVLTLHFAVRDDAREKSPLIDVELKNELTVARFVSKLRLPKVAKESWGTITTVRTIDSGQYSTRVTHLSD